MRNIMTKYIIKRILIAIPVLLGITVIDYAIMCMAGSPLEMLQGTTRLGGCCTGKSDSIRARQTIYVQYFCMAGAASAWKYGIFH